MLLFSYYAYSLFSFSFISSLINCIGIQFETRNIRKKKKIQHVYKSDISVYVLLHFCSQTHSHTLHSCCQNVYRWMNAREEEVQNKKSELAALFFAFMSCSLFRLLLFNYFMNLFFFFVVREETNETNTEKKKNNNKQTKTKRNINVK